MNSTDNELVTTQVSAKTLFLFTGHALAVVLCFILSAVSLRAEESSSGAGVSEGEKLERQMAADIKAKNWSAVESRIADGFQSMHPDGFRDRAGEIALLKQMN